MTLLNIFTVDNLDKIKIKYRLFRVRGLLPQSKDYNTNIQLLMDRIGGRTKSPCVVIKENGELFIAQPTGHNNPPDREQLFGPEVIIEPTGIERELDYGILTENNMTMAMKFLQFYLNGHLIGISSLWRPSAGMPYYQKYPDPDFKSNDAVMYRGFKIRLVILPENRIGICVDTTWKYASKNYLPAKITPDEVRKYQSKNCIYEFGNEWYEICIDSINGLNANEEKIGDLSLYDYVQSKNRGPKSQALSTLPKDCTVLTYRTRLNQVKKVPSALCRLTYSTNHPSVSNYHSETIRPPGRRRGDIEFIIQTYFNRWSFQGVPLKLSYNMLKKDCECLIPPDLEFGGGKILSFNNADGKIHTTLEDFGPQKRTLLHSTDAGFFVKKDFNRQYLIMPKSMHETFGEQYAEDIKTRCNMLYSPLGQIKFDPMIITYDDSVRPSVPTLGKEIVQSVTNAISGIFFPQGYGLAIIPRLDPRRKDKEDELANLVMRELRKMGIYVSVSHREIPTNSYTAMITRDGRTVYRITDDERISKKFRGYVENVVLNKILLLNSRWPFVLASPLHSDVIIGLDVKNRTAGFMVIFKDGRTLSFTASDSDQKEQLSRGHVSKQVYDILSKELSRLSRVHDITIHRDGKLFPEEILGIKDALNRLSNEKLIDSDYNCNFIEIRKSSRIPIRFFDVVIEQGSMKIRTENPKLGTYEIFRDDAFLCTTGRPFRYYGTTKPLHIIRIEGKMDFRLILEDIFALSNLTWTKPDYCSRLPISIKMIDIRLREFAGEYDEYGLKFDEEEEQ